MSNIWGKYYFRVGGVWPDSTANISSLRPSFLLSVLPSHPSVYTDLALFQKGFNMTF